jgi:hypothetical protein
MRNPPLDIGDRSASWRGGWRAIATLLALVASLSNLLVPGVLAAASHFDGSESGAPRFAFCGTARGDASGKAKPGLLIHHCPLCTAAVALPSPTPSFAGPGEAPAGDQWRLRKAMPVVSVRYSGVQARAPPALV